MLAFSRVQITQCPPLSQTIFSPCCSLNDRRKAAHSFYKIVRLFSLFCHFLARFCLLILLLMSGNVLPNPGPIFPCSDCAGNVTWRGRSKQCCTCSKWVHLKCSLLSSKAKTIDSSPSCFCWKQRCDFLLGFLPLVYLHCSIWPPLGYCSTVAPSSPSNLLSSFRLLCVFSLCTLTIAPCSWLSFYTFCFL